MESFLGNCVFDFVGFEMRENGLIMSTLERTLIGNRWQGHGGRGVCAASLLVGGKN